MKKCRLGEISKVEWGNTSLTKASFVDEGEFLAVSAAGADGRIGHAEHESHIPVISAIGANCGRMFFPTEPFTAIKNTMTVTPIHGNDSKFLYYFLSSIKMPKRGAAQPFLALKDIRNIQVPKYDIEKQLKIVSKLDNAFETIDQAIANTEKNIENAEKLEKSYLNQIFKRIQHESSTTFLPDISENLDNLRIPVTKRNRVNGGVPYYGASGIVDYVSEHIFNERLLCISEDGANLLARKYPIAFQISGKSWVNNHAHVLRFKSIQNEEFVMHYFNHIKLDKFISGMAQPKLNQSKLNKIPIPLPQQGTIEEINSNIKRFKVEMSNLRMINNEKLELLKQMKMSILDEAFKGERISNKS